MNLNLALPTIALVTIMSFSACSSDETLDMEHRLPNTPVTAPAMTPKSFGYSLGCYTYDVPETDRGWRISRILIKMGWTGRPSDGAERLYSSRCPTR